MDGFTGCYRGLVPKVCGNVVNFLASQKILDSLDVEEEQDPYDVEGSEEDK